MKRILTIAVIALFMLCGIAQAGKVVSSQIMNASFDDVTTSVNSTSIRIQGLDRVAFFVDYDETEHLGEIEVLTLGAGGSGYSENDILTVVQGGGSGGTAKVLTVNAGAVTSIELLTGGSGYSIEDSLATTVEPAGGTGCTVNVTQVGTALSAAFTLDISYDEINWLDASFYDYAGGATLQTSETISSDGSYYLWFNKDLCVPYVRMNVAATNTDANDVLDVQVYIVGKE